MTEPRPDWLWDRSGPPDPELAALERLLRPLGHDGRPLRELPAPPRIARRWWLLAAAAALLLALGGGLWLWPRARELAPGAASRAFATGKTARKIELGDLVTITLQPGSKLLFDHWQPGKEALFKLEQGALAAHVAPPPAVQPRFFLMDTPRGRVVDMGCDYVLKLLDDGSAYIDVLTGGVQFEFGDRRVFVPAGASTTVTKDLGASTPLLRGTDLDLRKAVQEFDMVTAKGLAEARGRALKAVLAACRQPRESSLVLWHLLLDPEPAFRAEAEQKLIDLVGPLVLQAKGGESGDPELWLPQLRLKCW